jgi:hypothetical protein
VEQDRKEPALGGEALQIAVRQVGLALAVATGSYDEPDKLGLGRDGLEVGEVEAQPAGVDQRALLAGVLAEHVAERPVEGVGGGMAAGDRPPAVGVDLDVDRVVDPVLGQTDDHEAHGGRLLLGYDRGLDDTLPEVWDSDRH